MSYENFPESDSPMEEKPTKKNNAKNILTGVLIVALLGTWGYIIFDKKNNRVEKENLTAQIVSSDSAKNELQQELNDAVRRLDELKTSNAAADSLIKTRNEEIDKLKSRISEILNDSNASQKDLNEARRLIAQLKGNIETYAAQIESLKALNTQLTEEKLIVTEQRDSVIKNYDSATDVIRQKEEVIDIGTTLHASGFQIAGIKEKNSGKEKVTDNAKKVDKLRISFMIDANLITPSGPKDIFITITGPDGKPVAVQSLGSGRFVTRDGTEHPFTKKIQINYIQGQKQPVTIEWAQDGDFKTGDYKVEVYNNGFKIGEGITTLEKGGLFG